MVTATNLANLHFLVLLVSAGPVPPRLPAISTDNIVWLDADTDAGELAP
jgi:hypothetical protein